MNQSIPAVQYEKSKPSQSMNMKNLPSSFQSPLKFDHKPQDLLLTTTLTGESSYQPISLASNSAIYRRRRQQIWIVISCLTLTFTGCGINFAFGVYQELYETLGGPFKDATPGQIDLIGTLAASLMTIGAPFASVWAKTCGPRRVTMLGGFFFAIATITASFGTQLWHFLLTQGIIQGCAACLTYIPAVTVSPGFFAERRGLAMGIILSGTGLGGMAWAPLLRYLVTEIGFRNTLRVTGVVAAVIIIMAASVLTEAKESIIDEQYTHGNRSPQHRAILPPVNWRIIGSNAFIAHASGGALHAAAYMTPVYFMSSYARTLGYSSTSGANIIALSNACNCGGKIVIGHLADRFGRLNALVLSTFVSAAATLGIWYIQDNQINTDMRRALFLGYACIYGISAGAYVSLFPTALAEKFGIRYFADINGLLYMIRGIGTLVGTSIGGALVRQNKSTKEVAIGFDRTFLFVGILLSGATISVAWARSLKTQIY